MTFGMGRLHSPTDRKEDVDYNPLLGFVAPAVRIDPHSHEVNSAPQTNLRQIADLVRDRRADQQPDSDKTPE